MPSRKATANTDTDESCTELDRNWTPAISRGPSGASLHRTHSSEALSAKSTTGRFPTQQAQSEWKYFGEIFEVFLAFSRHRLWYSDGD